MSSNNGEDSLNVPGGFLFEFYHDKEKVTLKQCRFCPRACEAVIKIRKKDKSIKLKCCERGWPRVHLELLGSLFGFPYHKGRFICVICKYATPYFSYFQSHGKLSHAFNQGNFFEKHGLTEENLETTLKFFDLVGSDDESDLHIMKLNEVSGNLTATLIEKKNQIGQFDSLLVNELTNKVSWKFHRTGMLKHLFSCGSCLPGNADRGYVHYSGVGKNETINVIAVDNDGFSKKTIDKKISKII